VLRVFLTFSILVSVSDSFAQQVEKIDSLQRIVKENANDSLVVDAYQTWSDLLDDAAPQNDFEIQEEIIRICLSNIQRYPCEYYNFFLNSLGNALNISGIISNRFGSTSKALEFYEHGLRVAKIADDWSTLSALNVNIGNIHTNAGDPGISIEYYQEASRISEEHHDSVSIAYAKINLGLAYSHRADSARMMGDFVLAASFDNLSMELVKFATDLSVKIKLDELVAFGLSLQANIFRYTDRLDSALLFDLAAMEIAEKIGYQPGIADAHGSLLQSYFMKGEIDMAIKHGLAGIKIGREIMDLNSTLNCAEGLFECYERTRQPAEALKFMEIFIAINDSFEIEYNSHAVLRHQFRVAYERAAAADSVAFVIEQRLADAKISEQELVLRNERTQDYVLYGSAGIFFIIGTLVLWSYRRKRQDYRTISLQKNEVEINRQKILDSIEYAERIQRSVLPQINEIRKFLPGVDVFFTPRDIVSGDFYWYANKNGMSYLALADCTGHGVPGAFMSLIGATLLKDIIVDAGIDNPAEALEKLDKEVRLVLRQNTADSPDDGMEIALLRIDHAKNSATFSGAGQQIYLVRENVELVSGEKRGIGGWVRKPERLPKFSNKEFSLKGIKDILMTTDGLEDQFGGYEDEKFGRERIASVILEKVPNVLDNLTGNFRRWKGDKPQLDDISAICIALN